MSIVMKAAALIAAAKHIALKRNTFYSNAYPYNLGYFHANGYLSFDCWNLVKAIIWTKGAIKDNYTVGTFAQANLGCGLGDWDGRTILNNCTKVSSNFASVTPGSFLLTPGDDHAGIYVGEFAINGSIFNVVESTAAWGGGVLCSYVDSDGTRRSCMGGPANYRWGWHGLLPWVDYSAASKKKKSIDTVAKEVLAGKWGNYPLRKKALEAAGYSYEKVQARVEELLAEKNQKLVKKLAQQVIDGKWGVNPDRQKKITAKYGAATYQAVQKLVDRMMS